MSAMDIDRPLDDMVQANKKARGTRAGRKASGSGAARGGARSGGAAPASGGRAKYAGSVPAQSRQSGGGAPASGPLAKIPPAAGKIIVSGLPNDVTENQVKELFAETIGPIKSAALAYNSHGKSTGTATIEFRDPKNATKAYQQYNGRMIDAKIPMKVEVVVDPSKRTLNERLGPAPTGPAASTSGAGPQRSAKSGGRAAAPASGGKAAGAKGGRTKRAPVTADQLDAEMEEWQKSQAAAATA